MRSFQIILIFLACTILANCVSENKTLEKQVIKVLKPGILKNAWPFTQDVMYWDDWPVAHPFLVFGGIAFNRKEYLNTWETFEHYPETEEVVRNLPIRNVLIW